MGKLCRIVTHGLELTPVPKGIAHMKGVGGLDGWRWIFILVGTPITRLILFVLISNRKVF